ncbi:unnamed protein product, partial [Ixodes pacificus]
MKRSYLATITSSSSRLRMSLGWIGSVHSGHEITHLLSEISMRRYCRRQSQQARCGHELSWGKQSPGSSSRQRGHSSRPTAPPSQLQRDSVSEETCRGALPRRPAPSAPFAPSESCARARGATAPDGMRSACSASSVDAGSPLALPRPKARRLRKAEDDPNRRRREKRLPGLWRLGGPRGP